MESHVPVPPVSPAPGAKPPETSVSVVIPIRNEIEFIDLSVGALQQQDYGGPLEIVCVDGESDDGTRERLAEIAAADPRVRVVDNPGRTAASAMNIGARAASHEVIVRVDAHAIADPDYVRHTIEVMHRTGADCVGGRWTLVGDGTLGRAIAAALSSRFGAGPATWRQGQRETETDTVPYGAWRKEHLLAIGGFDEALLRNQDYELAHRVRKHGGRVVYSPAIHSRYHARGDLRSLWRQYFQYGQWKARVIRKHPGSLKLRHLAAPALVLGLIVGLVLMTTVGAPFGLLFAAGADADGALAVVAATAQARRDGWDLFILLPPLFLLIHCAWGIGFWFGVPAALLQRNTT